jgi:hypothetical protein
MCRLILGSSQGKPLPLSGPATEYVMKSECLTSRPAYRTSTCQLAARANRLEARAERVRTSGWAGCRATNQSRRAALTDRGRRTPEDGFASTRSVFIETSVRWTLVFKENTHADVASGIWGQPVTGWAA